MILAVLKDKLQSENPEWTGGEHVVIAHHPSGKRLEIDEIREDDDGVINIITGGRCSGETDSEMMGEIFETEDETKP